MVISTFSLVTCEQHVNAIHEKWKDNQSLQEVSLTQKVPNSTQQFILQILNGIQQIHYIYAMTHNYKQLATQFNSVV